MITSIAATRRALMLCASAVAFFELAPGASGQTFTWNNPAGGTFGVASNWSPAGGPPNSATESAHFGPLAIYNVTFTANVTNQDLTSNRGFAQFSSNGPIREYSLGGDATITGGSGLIVGGVGLPMVLEVGDQLTLDGGQLTVRGGSRTTAARLSIASGANAGTVLVSGPGASLHVTGTGSFDAVVGRSSGTALLTLENGAAGTISGVLAIADSVSQNSHGTVHVLGGASLTLQSGMRMGLQDALQKTAQMFISGPGSRVAQTGAGTIELGATIATQGLILVHDGGSFTSGTGTITINPRGRIEAVDGGAFRANGRLALGGGSIVIDGGALVSAHSATLTGGTLNVGMGPSFPGTGSATFANSLVAGGGALINIGGGTFASSGAATINTGAAFRVSGGSAIFSAPLRIDGAGSVLDVTGTGTAATNAALTLSSGGRVNVASSTFAANGTLLINGGQIDVGPGGSFRSNVSTSINAATINITGGGAATFANSLGAINGRFNVGSGSGTSTLHVPTLMTMSGGTLALDSGAELDLTGHTLELSEGAVLTKVGQFRTNGGTINATGDAKIQLSSVALIAGNINLTAGASATMNGFHIGTNDGPGNIMADGTSSAITSTGFSRVGSQNAGTLDLRNGARASTESCLVASPAPGRVTVQGGADLVVDGVLRISESGASGSGIVTVTGPGSTLTMVNDEDITTIGGATLTSGGGTLAIANNASVQLGDTINVNETGVIELSGGTLLLGAGSFTLGSTLTVDGGLFRHTGGTIVDNTLLGATIRVEGGGTAEFTNGGSTYVMDPGLVFDGVSAHFHFPDGLEIGNDNGALLSVGGSSSRLIIGGSGATIGTGTGNSGNISVNGATATIAGVTRVGVNGGTANLTFSNAATGTLGDIEVGAGGGTGTLRMFGDSFGAPNIIIGNLTIGATGTGSVNMQAGAMSQNGAATLSIGGVAGTLSMGGSGTFTSGTGTITIHPGGTLQIGGGSHFIARAPMVELPGSTVLITGTTSFGGRLDLTNQTRFIDYDAGNSPLTTVRAQLASGYASDSWSGNGIMSSTAAANPGFALGFAEASDLFTTFPATFQGRTIDATTLLVTYTRYGDANLDRAVNLQDFNRLASNFGSSSGATWAMGDFTFDGIVNLQDFNRLAANFGLSAVGPGVTPDDWAALASAVPEPAGTLGLTALSMLLRRRRQGRQGAPRETRPHS